jgi:hypothetical protein
MMPQVASPYVYHGEPKNAAIMIILLKNGVPDDKLVIRPVDGTTDFTAVFTQNTVGVRSELTLVHSELFPYIERFIEVISYDRLRCDFVQIDVPGYTSVVLKSNELYTYMDTMYAQVRSLFNSWPMEVVAERREPRYTWHDTDAEMQANDSQANESKPSASPRVTRSMAQRMGM